MIHHKVVWSTSYDMANKLIIRRVHIPKDWQTDTDFKDPDGIPLIRFSEERIVRVRRMTDKEFEECVKEYGYKFEVDCKVMYTKEEKE